MTWKAKIDIDKYKAGDVVPDEMAVVWNGMYKESPVERVNSEVKKEEPKELKIEVKKVAKKKTAKKK